MAPQGTVLFYYLFPLLLTFLAFYGYRYKRNGKVILFLLLFFSMFRGENVGNDTKAYLTNYIDGSAFAVDDLLAGNDIEEGFGRQLEITSKGIAWGISTFGLPRQSILIAFALIQLLFLYYALRRLKVNVSLALLFYVLIGSYFFSLTAARQMAAVSVLIMGTTYIFETGKKKFLFFLYSLLAITMHVSAAFMVCLYFIRYIKIKRQVLLFIMVLACLMGVFTSVNIMDIFYSSINLPYLTDTIDDFNGLERTSLLSRVSDVVRYVFFISLFILRTKEKTCDNFDLFFGLAVIMMALFSHTNGMINRIAEYVVVYIVIYIAKVLVEQKLLYNKQFCPILYAYMLLCFIGMRTVGVALKSGYYLMF